MLSYKSGEDRILFPVSHSPYTFKAAVIVRAPASCSAVGHEAVWKLGSGWKSILSANEHSFEDSSHPQWALALSLVILGVSFKLSQTNAKCKHLGHRHLFQFHLCFQSIAKSIFYCDISSLEHFFLLDRNNEGIQEWDSHRVSSHLQSEPLTARLWLSVHLASQMTGVLDPHRSGLVFFNCRDSPYHFQATYSRPPAI